MSSLDSRQNINEQENHDGGKGKGMGAKGQKGKRAKGQKGKRAKGQKPQTVISPNIQDRKYKQTSGKEREKEGGLSLMRTDRLHCSVTPDNAAGKRKHCAF